MAGPGDDDDAYENPAFDNDEVFRDTEQPHAGVSLGLMMRAEEEYGEPRIDERSASPDVLAAIAAAEQDGMAAIAEAQQAESWDDAMENLRTYVRGQDDEMETTAILDSLRADVEFMGRIEPYVSEGLHAEEITRDLLGYQTGYTMYTLALRPDWLVEPAAQQDLWQILPTLRRGDSSADDGLDTHGEARTALLATWALVEDLRSTYDALHFQMTEDAAVDWIDMAYERCIGTQNRAQRIIRLAERLAQQYERHSRYGEVDQDATTGSLQRIEEYLHNVTKMAVFVLMDGMREAERQRANGGP
ncbi:hypothetical protein B0A55_03191 [Friedmanniomyces simplex]|uniref:Uncharacterized protein n=1 Tax=Friedmanniomyces simplex TaxID=329884 RepID=A0A4U0XJI6_9PEZI|nr:hypothetical protein B0A55_03191 [Friedmanniomyces simplex]